MTSLPKTPSVPVVRVDFSDDAVWAQLMDDIVSPTEEGFGANVEFVEDRALAGLDQAALVGAMPKLYPSRYEHPVIFVVDSVTISLPDHPVLVIDLQEEDACEPFRSTPRQVQAIENNLSIANMDFDDLRTPPTETASSGASSDRSCRRPGVAPRNSRFGGRDVRSCR